VELGRPEPAKLRPVKASLFRLSGQKQKANAAVPAPQSNVGTGIAPLPEVTEQHTSTFPIRKYPRWQSTIEAAVNEPDPTKLLPRVHEAEMAVFNRLQELASNPQDASYQAERQAITDALKTLWVLKRDKLGFPDWERR